MGHSKYETCYKGTEKCTKGDTTHWLCDAAPGVGGVINKTCQNGTKGCPKSGAPHFFCG